MRQASGRERIVVICLCGLLAGPGCTSQRAAANEARRPTSVSAALPAAGAPAAKAADLGEVTQLIVERTNAARRQEGLSQLRVDRTLAATAEDFAGYMARANQLSHEAGGTTLSGRVTAHGYDYCLIFENIADAASTQPPTSTELAERFVDGWLDSPGHRKNLLDPDVTDIGVGVARNASTGAYVAVQLFGRPISQQIAFSVANQTDETIEYAIGSDAFMVPPNARRTHQICRPAGLTLRGAAASHGPRQSFPVRGGEQLIIVRSGSGIDVQTIPPP